MRRYLRAELVLPLTIIAAAAIVAASELMTTFEFTAGGEVQAISSASDRHGYALLILAALTAAGTVYAIVTGLRSVAIATAVFGCAALLLFLVLDFPDAGKAGPLDDDPGLYFADARADPAIGFWLEAVGTVVLGLATVAFATLSSAQLRAWPELIAARRQAREDAGTGAGARQDRDEPERKARRRERRRQGRHPIREASEKGRERRAKADAKADGRPADADEPSPQP